MLKQRHTSIMADVHPNLQLLPDPVQRLIASHLPPSTALLLALVHPYLRDAGESQTFETLNLALWKSEIDYSLAPDLRNFYWPPTSLILRATERGDTVRRGNIEEADLLQGALRVYTDLLERDGRKGAVRRLVVDCTRHTPGRIERCAADHGHWPDVDMRDKLHQPGPVQCGLEPSLAETLRAFPTLPAVRSMSLVLHENWAEYLAAFLRIAPGVTHLALVPEPQRALPPWLSSATGWPELHLTELKIDQAGPWCEPLLLSWLDPHTLRHLALRDPTGRWQPPRAVMDRIQACTHLTELLLPWTIYQALNLEAFQEVEELGMTGMDYEKQTLVDLCIPPLPHLKTLWQFRAPSCPRPSPAPPAVPVLQIPPAVVAQLRRAPRLEQIRFAQTQSDWLGQTDLLQEGARGLSCSGVSPTKRLGPADPVQPWGTLIVHEARSAQSVDEDGNAAFYHVRMHAASYFDAEGRAYTPAHGDSYFDPAPLVWQDYTSYRGRLVPKQALDEVYQVLGQQDWSTGHRTLGLSLDAARILERCYHDQDTP